MVGIVPEEISNELEGIIHLTLASTCLISNKLALVETNSLGQSQLDFRMFLSFKYFGLARLISATADSPLIKVSQLEQRETLAMLLQVKLF